MPNVFRTPLLLAAALLVTPFSYAEDPLLPAWHDASFSLFRDAQRRFSAAQGPEARFGEALTLLQLQPKTDANIEHAAQLLAEVVRTTPNTEPGIAALYYLGRLEHAHRSPRNLPAATTHYRALIAARPDHPLAEQAIIKLGVIELYADLTPAERLAHYAALDRQAKTLKTSTAQRDIHILLAEAALRFALGSDLALEHYLAADRAGIVRATVVADIWVRIGELARETGRNDVARTYYSKFLDTFERDVRRRIVTEHLEALPPAMEGRP